MLEGISLYESDLSAPESVHSYIDTSGKRIRGTRDAAGLRGPPTWAIL